MRLHLLHILEDLQKKMYFMCSFSWPYIQLTYQILLLCNLPSEVAEWVKAAVKIFEEASVKTRQHVKNL